MMCVCAQDFFCEIARSPKPLVCRLTQKPSKITMCPCLQRQEFRFRARHGSGNPHGGLSRGTAAGWRLRFFFVDVPFFTKGPQDDNMLYHIIITMFIIIYNHVHDQDHDDDNEDGDVDDTDDDKDDDDNDDTGGGDNGDVVGGGDDDGDEEEDDDIDDNVDNDAAAVMVIAMMGEVLKRRRGRKSDKQTGG